MPNIAILKASAERVSNWEENYGVFAEWYVGSSGLVLSASTGGNHIRKQVSWFELEQARYPANLLDRVEIAVLSGLSS